MITMQNVRKTYGNFTFEISMELPEGQILGLIGKNGAGKSTAIKLILGLCRAEEGTVTVLGSDSKELSEKVKQDIGVSLAESGFSGELTVNDVKHILKKMYHSFDENYFIKQSENLKLPMNKKIKELSGGMRQRLGIAQAILNDPKILILDEPTAGLDPKERVRFRNILSVLSKDRIVILSTHIVSDIESIANHVIMIKEKQLLKNDTVPNICKELEGKVFEKSINESEIQEFEQKRIILSMRQESEKMMVRYYSEEEDNNARPCTPNLEDVFLVTYREEK